MTSPGTTALAALEREADLRRVMMPTLVAPAIGELRASSRLVDGILMLGRWALDYPAATAYLMDAISRDPAVSLELAPMILGCTVVSESVSPDGADAILAAAFPKLTGPYRDAVADRPGVRQLLKLPEGVGYEVVPEPDPSWLWPRGTPFPAGDTVAGVQARLNYLRYGAGPVNGEWSDATRRALVRWQVYRGLPPTGELDDDSIEELVFQAGDAPA